MTDTSSQSPQPSPHSGRRPSRHRSQPPRVVAKDPRDLVALVPLALGFEPTESLTLLTFRAPGSGTASPTASSAGFHARIDLPRVQAGDGGRDGDGPPDEEDLAALVGALRDPVLRHGVERAAVVVHSRRPVLATGTARGLVAALAGPGSPGVQVFEVLRADGEHWWRIPDPGGSEAGTGSEGGGTPYDLTSHPFTAQAVLAGMVLHPSRDALAATLEPDVGGVARVHARLQGRAGIGLAGVRGGEAERRWARGRVLEAVAGDPLDDDDAARLLHHLPDPGVRDAALSPLTRASARDLVDLWADLLRRAPAPLRPGPAALLGLCAWVAGEGALAWCAVDRARAEESTHVLARVVQELLERAEPPTSWVHDGSAFVADGWSAGSVG